MGCIYPSQTNAQKMIIDETQIQIFANGDLTFSKNYSIVNLVEGDNSMTYQIKLEDGEIWIGEVSNNTLTTTRNSVISSIYERLR